jgi:hypothetical protein
MEAAKVGLERAPCELFVAVGAGNFLATSGLEREALAGGPAKIGVCRKAGGDVVGVAKHPLCLGYIGVKARSTEKVNQRVKGWLKPWKVDGGDQGIIRI